MQIIEGGVDSTTGEVIQTFENVSNFIRAAQRFTTEVFSARDLEDCGERPQVRTGWRAGLQHGRVALNRHRACVGCGWGCLAF